MYIFHNGIMFSSLVEKIPTKLKQLSIAMYNHTNHCDITEIIIHIKKLLDSDWLRAVQFKCNTSAKSVTPVQKV